MAQCSPDSERGTSILLYFIDEETEAGRMNKCLSEPGDMNKSEAGLVDLEVLQVCGDKQGMGP
jgi:hypothetical protein